MSTKACLCGKLFLGKPARITFGENKDVNSWIKFRLLYDNSCAPVLGGSWCATTENTDVHKGMLMWESSPLGKPATITFRKNKDVTQPSVANWRFQNVYSCFCWESGWNWWPCLRRSLCHGNERHGIDPNMSNSGHHDCSTQAAFLCTADKLQCWHMLAHWTQDTGPSHAFSTSQAAFIWAIALVVLWNPFPGWPCANRAQRKKKH